MNLRVLWPKTLLKKILLVLFLIIVISYLIFAVSVKPSNDRSWVKDNAVLTYAERDGDLLRVYNVRNFKYRAPLDFDVDYYNRTYDLSKLNSVDFIVAPFNPPSAHTFVSFGFEDGSHLAVSIEARREEGEFYNIFKGMFRRFEIVYVFADEADVVKLRTNFRSEGNVYMYPIKVSNEKAVALLMDMINTANGLVQKPMFYNTITNNCTVRLVRHVNAIASKDSKIGFSYKYMLPAYSDELVYEMGLINDTGTFAELKEKYRITPKARACHDAADFAQCIRKD